MKKLIKRFLSVRSLHNKSKQNGHRNQFEPTLKSELLEVAAKNKGLPVKRLSKRVVIVDINKKDGWISFDQMNGPSSTVSLKNILDDKFLHLGILKQNNLSVPKQDLFYFEEKEKAGQFAYQLGWPVVIKPNNLSRSKGVRLNVDNEEDFFKIFLDTAILTHQISNNFPQLIVEKQYPGKSYRIFVINDKVYAAHNKAILSVIGDGRQSILELIRLENEKRSVHEYRKNKLIPEKISQLPYLKKKGKNLSFVPKAGERIYLRETVYGGDYVMVTDTMHPTFKDICVKAVKSIPGLKYAGVDIITEDITQPATPTNYIINELEFSPGPAANYATVGEPVNIAEGIIDFYIQTFKIKSTSI